MSHVSDKLVGCFSATEASLGWRKPSGEMPWSIFEKEGRKTGRKRGRRTFWNFFKNIFNLQITETMVTGATNGGGLLYSTFRLSSDRWSQNINKVWVNFWPMIKSMADLGIYCGISFQHQLFLRCMKKAGHVWCCECWKLKTVDIVFIVFLINVNNVNNANSNLQPCASWGSIAC